MKNRATSILFILFCCACSKKDSATDTKTYDWNCKITQFNKPHSWNDWNQYGSFNQPYQNKTTTQIVEIEKKGTYDTTDVIVPGDTFFYRQITDCDLVQ